MDARLATARGAQVTEFLLYQGRSGQTKLVKKTQAGWDYLIEEMERDNRVTFVELVETDLDFDGSYADGFMWVDDGGEISTVELTQVPANGYVHYH